MLASNAAQSLHTDQLLMPRISAFPLTNPTIEKNGMLVQLTSATASFQPGFYYWDATALSWIKLNNENSNQNWNLQGNSNTTTKIL